MITAVAYFRTSSSANVGEDKDSEKRQRDAVTKYAKQNKIKIVGEFTMPPYQVPIPLINAPALSNYSNTYAAMERGQSLLRTPAALPVI